MREIRPQAVQLPLGEGREIAGVGLLGLEGAMPCEIILQRRPHREADEALLSLRRREVLAGRLPACALYPVDQDEPLLPVRRIADRLADLLVAEREHRLPDDRVVHSEDDAA